MYSWALAIILWPPPRRDRIFRQGILWMDPLPRQLWTEVEPSDYPSPSQQLSCLPWKSMLLAWRMVCAFLLALEQAVLGSTFCISMAIEDLTSIRSRNIEAHHFAVLNKWAPPLKYQ